MEEKDIRFAKLQNLIKKNRNPYHHTLFVRNTNTHILYDQYHLCSRDALQKIKDVFQLAGRVKFKRLAGKKVGFLDLHDQSGAIQLYCHQDIMLEDDFASFTDDLDVGDIIGITGTIMKTNRGELTIRVKSFVILAKALENLPDKYHGLVDIEDRYRKRYLDLMMSRDVAHVFRMRSKIIRLIQKFLDNEGYLEVETPILQHLHGGALAKPFQTYHNSLKSNLFLRIATELHLKKLVVGGFEKVYEIGRIFRNEGIDSHHNPEFTSVEIYTAYDDMNLCLQLCQNIFRFVIQNLKLPPSITFMHHQINLHQKFQVTTMAASVKKVTGLDFVKHNFSVPELHTIVQAHKIDATIYHLTAGNILVLLFEKYVEKTLIDPTFICQYPHEVSPLAKLNYQDPRFTDRFELFIGGCEFANGFAELNDPFDQKERFLNQLQEKKLGNEASHALDKDFIQALRYGLPPTAGLGIGIDRMVMLLTEQTAIKDVILFPTLKRKK